jgi:hypothetical protein
VSFLAPAAFALAALIPVVIAMYLLRLRRTEQVVSSVYLWQRMVRDVEANAPWQRLRRNLLLILQLLTLIALILALARPSTWAEGSGGQAAILILDTSPSMAAIDTTPNRLEAAKAQAVRWVDGLPDDVRVTVIAGSDGAQVLAAASQDRRQVRQAIKEARVGDAGMGSDLTAAFELASAISAQQPDTEVIVYSDGRVTLPKRLVLKGRARYSPIGISDDNQAIDVLSLRPTPDGGLTAFVQVVNYGQETAQRRLSLYAGDAQDRRLVQAYDLDIPPGERRAAIADDLALETSVVEARLGGEDAFLLDDQAWTVHRIGHPASVALVTEGNLFLETGLALFPTLEVTTIAPEDWVAGTVDGGSGLPTVHASDLTILDAYVPVTATLPAGNLWFIAPPRSTEVFSVTGWIDQPVPRAVLAAASASREPLLSHVSLDGVKVLEAARVSMPIWGRPVIVGDTTGGSSPLLWVGERGGRRVAVLAFDLRRSDLPLQVAFPLLLANLTGWLAPARGSQVPTLVSPGTTASLLLPVEVEPVRVTAPDGSQVQVVLEAGQAVLADIRQLGLYEVRLGDEEREYFAVNLFSHQESDVRPAENLAFVESEVGVEPGAEPGRTARREWWRPIALLALALLVTEWLVYHRTTLARLWAGIRRRS